MKTNKRFKTLNPSVGAARNRTYIVTQLTDGQKGSIQECQLRREQKVQRSRDDDDEKQCRNTDWREILHI